MKIRAAWITSGFSADENDYGGAAAIHNLARELSIHPDIELTVFSFYYPVNKPEYNFYRAKVYSFGQSDAPAKIDKLKIWRRCMKKFEEVHSMQRFNLIHAMWANEPGYIASKLSRRFNIPLIVNICGGELAEIREIDYGSRLGFWQKRFVDKSFKRASRIVCGSDFILEKISEYCPEFLTKTVKIPFGVDEKQFKHFLSGDRSQTFLISIASAVPVKDYLTLFQAVKILSGTYPDVRLKIYGRDDKNELKKMADDMGLDGIVQIMGFADYEKIPAALSESDIFVSCSLYESQNMSLIEAGLCGLPVLSTDTGAAKEVTENIIEPLEPQKLANRIKNVMENLSDEKQRALKKIPELKEEFALENTVRRFVLEYIFQIRNPKSGILNKSEIRNSKQIRNPKNLLKYIFQISKIWKK